MRKTDPFQNIFYIFYEAFVVMKW